LTKKGEILTPADKENIEVGVEYMEGKPPAEVIRICNEMLKLNVVQYYALMNNVMVSLFSKTTKAASSLPLLWILLRKLRTFTFGTVGKNWYVRSRFAGGYSCQEGPVRRRR
jgi:hypothetical protein